MHSNNRQIRKRSYRSPEPNYELELIQPPLERTRVELESILRWEEDGGQVVKVVTLSVKPAFPHPLSADGYRP
jgi:hypothetical protein